MEKTLTETKLVKLPNTPTGHGQKKEAYRTLNSVLFLVNFLTSILESKERCTQRYTEDKQRNLGLESVACVHRTRFIFCSLYLKSCFRIIESFWLEGTLEACIVQTAQGLAKTEPDYVQTSCENSMNRDPANFFDGFSMCYYPHRILLSYLNRLN